MSCPDPDRVLDYVARNLAARDHDSIELHIDGCEECRALLAELARGDVVALEPAATPPEAERYELGSVIGTGGMGEVLAAHDARILREVAVKRMQPPLERARMSRFLREARVQGGLEHPAVVPVHDIGIDADGNPYFVMKRLAGQTLAERLDGTDERMRRQLLDRFIDVCLAIAFAHTRGVVHRDLKPSNIMLGDFGETYVIDWGLAHVDGERVDHSTTNRADGDVADTRTGELLGTLGYMAPEQVRGTDIDSRVDVFALGCILYEILAGTPALPRGKAAIDVTLAAPSLRPSARAVVPPELDDICAAATSADRAHRPTARAIADAVRAYLDGDRDLRRRRELADRHAAAAATAVAGGAGDDARAAAMREASRALALDPEHDAAQAVLGAMLREAPSGAVAAAESERSRMRRHVVQRSALGYIASAIAVLAMYSFPTRHSWSIALLFVENLAMGVLVLVLARISLPVRSRWYFMALGLTFAGLVTGALMLGPLLVIPFYVIGSLAVWLSLPFGYPPWITVTTYMAAFAVPFVLELAGILPSTFEIANNQLVLTTNVIDLLPGWSTAMFVVLFVFQVAGVVYIIVFNRRIHDTMQDRLHVHIWQLEQLLPAAHLPASRVTS